MEGEANEAGLKAQFGKLGTIDVSFKPLETLSTERPPKECEGPPSKTIEGLFVGTIRFTGELEYVKIESSEVRGTMRTSRSREWRCPKHKQLMRSEAEEKPATFAAAAPGCDCSFSAFGFVEPDEPRLSAFAGFQFASQGGMEIIRSTSVDAGPAAFTFNHKAGTARLRPPKPFTGIGTFKRRPNGPDLWRSTIQVPLLGVEPLNLSSPGSRAVLMAKLPEFR